VSYKGVRLGVAGVVSAPLPKELSMAQIRLPLEPAGFTAPPLPAPPPGRARRDAAGGDSLEAIGFEIGWDHAHYALTPPLPHLHDGSPVRQGWGAGRLAFGRRTLRATPQVRKWLQLRLSAWQRGRVFEGVQVTPHFLGQIEATHCPVTREALTHGTGAGSDASVDRVNNRAGYAAGNLVVMSVRANQAKGACAWDDAMAVVRRIEAGVPDAEDGLDAAQWSRLAVLTSFVTPLAHEVAACLPLLVLPPNRLRLLNPVQALQAVLTRLFTAPGYARRLLGLAALMPGDATRHAFQIFMHTLLARRIAAGPQLGVAAASRAMEDTWADPLVNRRWQALALRLDAALCEQLLQRAARRGLVGAAWRWIGAGAATEGWGLETGGYVEATATLASGPRTPGSTRSLGSQKLAS
jgi:hypothetical protein